MSDSALHTDVSLEPQPPMGVRYLHNYAYCPRLFYYQWVENIFQENADTVEGSHTHRNVDKPSALRDPSYLGLPEGAQLRRLKLESARLGLVGVIDIVEQTGQGLMVVDYKKGAAWRNEKGERIVKNPDAIQMAAYALLLKENGQAVGGAAVYYAAEKRQVAVPLTDDLYARCESLLAEAKAVANAGKCPPPLAGDPRCLYCSAYPVCLPGESAFWAASDKQAAEIKQPPRPDNDEGEVLVVQTPGAKVGHQGGHFVVTVNGGAIRKLPAHQVRGIYLYGPVQVSAQAVHACLELGVEVAYFSPAGRYLGMVQGLPASGIDARLGQYRMFYNEQLRLMPAREMIRAKIHNQRVLLMRNSENAGQAAAELERLRDQAEKAETITGLMGIEGLAAAVYFSRFAAMLKCDPEITSRFDGRNRRPPRDPVNALLSLGYSMLCKELTGICHAVGLDPFVGVLHQPRYGRPALALDIMEEFRPLIADSLAVSALNRGEIGLSDFIISADGVHLNENGRKAYWEAYFRRMDTEVTHPQFGYKMQYRRMLEVQVRQLWRLFRGEAGKYYGFTTR